MEQLPSVQQYTAETFALGQSIVKDSRKTDISDNLNDYIWHEVNFETDSIPNTSSVMPILHILGFEEPCSIVVWAEEQAAYTNTVDGVTEVSPGYESVVVTIKDDEITRAYDLMLEEPTGLTISKDTQSNEQSGTDEQSISSGDILPQFVSAFDRLDDAVISQSVEADMGVRDIDLTEAEALRSLMSELSKLKA